MTDIKDMTTTEIEERVNAAIPEAQALIDEDWYQVSARYRELVRIPPNESAFERLARVNPVQARQLLQWLEERAASLLHSLDDTLEHKTVDVFTFRAYKKLGGGNYHMKLDKPPRVISKLLEQLFPEAE